MSKRRKWKDTIQASALLVQTFSPFLQLLQHTAAVHIQYNYALVWVIVFLMTNLLRNNREKEEWSTKKDDNCILKKAKTHRRKFRELFLHQNGSMRKHIESRDAALTYLYCALGMICKKGKLGFHFILW